MPDIIYTKVDEAPELASASLLPIIRKFAAAAGVSVGTKDISLAGRILAAFPDHLAQIITGRMHEALVIQQNRDITIGSCRLRQKDR